MCHKRSVFVFLCFDSVVTWQNHKNCECPKMELPQKSSISQVDMGQITIAKKITKLMSVYITL